MPYSIAKRNERYCLVKKSTGKMLNGGCHATREQAMAQMAAINISEHQSSMKAISTRRKKMYGYE